MIRKKVCMRYLLAMASVAWAVLPLKTEARGSTADNGVTKVLFFFDTEDFTCDESNDAIRDIANILKEEGVRGNFAMIGYLGQFIVDKGRNDVIEALSHHIIGCQTLYHSKPPTINEYGDVADFSLAWKRTMAEEGRAFDILKRTLGTGRIWCSVFPGVSNSYVGLYVHSQLGSPIFGGGGGSFTPGERPVAWFVNQFHLPYYKQLHLESFIPPQPPLDVNARLDELATNTIVTLYMHPHMAISTKHWDGPNFTDGREPVWGDWRPTPKRDKKDVAVYYRRLRELVHAIKNDKRFEVLDCESLCASFAPRRVIRREDIAEIRKVLLTRLGPIEEPSSYCVADAFQAAARFLCGDSSFMPGYVWGFLEPPKGIAEPTVVSASDLRVAASRIDFTRFLPHEITVGEQKIGPADFLYGALEVLATGADKVTIMPRDQLGPIGELMPSLSTFTTAGGWCIYSPNYKDKYMTPRLRLQLWTLRYEDFQRVK